MNSQQILQLADTCVKCGLCLPQCPTYGKTLQEAESPRGRVAVIQGLLSGILPYDGRATECIDRCLECHACEVVCPAATPVTEIIDAIRTKINAQHSKNQLWIQRQLLNLAVYPDTIMPLVQIYQNSVLQTALRSSNLLKLFTLGAAENLLPTTPLSRIATGTFTAITKNIGKVAIFPGCLGRFIDTGAIKALINILNHLGYDAYIPEQSCCCGALHKHSGFAAEADVELSNTANIMSKHDKILTVASACLETLKRSTQLGNKVVDATDFVADLDWSATLNPKSKPQTVWVHVPCTQRHPIGNPKASFNLLNQIPGVTAIPLNDNDVCCGAAGTYMLRHPELSQELLDDKFKIIKKMQATVIVTTNTGCALRLKTGAHKLGIKLQVYHPLEILAQHLVLGSA
ncbi:hypothetical protein TI04_09055 [Achromatium sp. WMS2]|nr:hypothetical protein TI04_09055 [Achromatium sp. WMS2]